MAVVLGGWEAQEGRAKAKIPIPQAKSASRTRLRRSIRYGSRLPRLRRRIDIRNHSNDRQEQRAANPGGCVYRTIGLGN